VKPPWIVIESSFCEKFGIAPWELNMDNETINDSVRRHLQLTGIENRYTPKQK
jgi:hypothetical protein